jgi:CHAT domain-containing protein
LIFRLPAGDPIPGIPVRPLTAQTLLHLSRFDALANRRLAAHPGDAKWAEAGIALELLMGEHEATVRGLGRAADAWPGSYRFILYEALEYAEEAEVSQRDDLLALAFDRLSRVVRFSSELRPIALYDRAILAERLFLFQQAREDWDWYLKIDSSAAWKREAARHRAALIQRIAAAQASAKESASNIRSDEYEGYPVEQLMDIAVQQWLPQLSERPQFAMPLQKLAARALREHEDAWFSDLLSGSRRPEWQAGLAALARAAALNATGDRAAALFETDRALGLFRRAGSRPGSLAAQVERLYTLNRSLLMKACLDEAGAIAEELQHVRYPFLLARYQIEISGCQSRANLLPSAEQNLRRARTTARAAHYPAIELRAISILVNQLNVNGNSTEAWNACWEGVVRFWSGNYGPVRGQTLYFNCSTTAERLGDPELALAFEQEAAHFGRQISNHAQVAEGYFREGLLTFRLGDHEGAAGIFELGRQALDQLPDNEVRSRYQWWLDKALAECYLVSGHVSSALSRLQRFGGLLPGSELSHERADYYRLRAMASASSGDRAAQYRFLSLATDEMERAINRLQREDDRIRWRSQSGSVFRPLVEWLLTEPDQIGRALQIWEWYLDRTGTLETAASWRDTASLPLSALRSTTLISFLWLPDRVGYWRADDRRLDFAWADGSTAELAALCRRFARQCSDEQVPEREVRETGRDLFSRIFGMTLRGRLAGRTLLIEADGDLGSIPFEALVGPEGRYLAEDHSVVYSPGLWRWHRLASRPGVSTNVRSLVVAAPAVFGKLAREFPPLPDARREGEMVAARLPNSTLLAGREGTLPEVLANLRSAELFHFAGHGLSNSDDGALLLTPTDGGEEASLLTTAQFANQSFERCRLAVLSACSSGAGESRGPVNPNSLVSGLIRAGVRDVVASRWRVDSKATLALMRSFYERLLSTGDVGGALQSAAAEVRSTRGMGHPYFWASFSAFGE